MRLHRDVGVGVLLTGNRAEVHGAAGPVDGGFTAPAPSGDLSRWARGVVDGLALRDLADYRWRIGVADGRACPAERRACLDALIHAARGRGIAVESWFHTSVGHAAHGLMRTPAVHAVVHLSPSELQLTSWVVPRTGLPTPLWRLGFDARFPLGTELVQALVRRGHGRDEASAAVVHRIAGAAVLMAMAAVENGPHGIYRGAPLHVHIAGRAEVLRADFSSAIRTVLRRQDQVGNLQRMTPFSVVEPAWLADAALRGADPSRGVDSEPVFFVEPLGFGVEIRGRGALSYFTPTVDLGPSSALRPWAGCPTESVFWSAAAILGDSPLRPGRSCLWAAASKGRALELLERDLTRTADRCRASGNTA